VEKHLFKRSGFVLAGAFTCLMVSACAGCSTGADPALATISHTASDWQMPKVTLGPDQPDTDYEVGWGYTGG
jgi:hypothetical protein